ncbi:MAG: PEP-CTERM sorting domain-containing protein [Planctomycetota bacterium]|jgi:hypothetical protein
MKTIASMATALALLAVLHSPASADEIYTGTIHQGVPQSMRPGYPPSLTHNPDGRGRLTWGAGNRPSLTLGLDFEVKFWQGITITELGVWDDAVIMPDGSVVQQMDSGVILTLWAWHDDGSYEALAGVVTSPNDPYNQGVLKGDYRYFPIEPTALKEGQKFTVTVGYSNHNTASSGNSGTDSQNLEPRPDFHGGEIVMNIGSGRYGLSPWNFPTYTDTGPANRYHAGSFTFNPNPEPGTLLLVGGALSVVGVVRRRRRRKSAA